jgi:hypothetical protein
MNGGSSALAFILAVILTVWFTRLVASIWWNPTMARSVARSFLFIAFVWLVLFTIAEFASSSWFIFRKGSEPGYAFIALALSFSALTIRHFSARLGYSAPETRPTPSDVRLLRFKFTVFFAALLLTIGCLYEFCVRPIPFERAAWDRYQSKWLDIFSTRARMADALLSSGSLLGKSRGEIVLLLGEPPPTDYFSDWNLVYQLGAERGLISIDSEWLIIRIGKDGRTSDARLAHD